MDDDTIRRYLLGDLPQEDREVVGERILADAVFYERVCDAENDLIDDAARGALKPVEQEKLRSYLAETRQLDRLQFAEALSRRGNRGRRTWSIGLATAAAALIAIYTGTMLLHRGPEKATPNPMAPATTAIATFYLPAGAVRGSGSMRTISLPANTAAVELQLETENLSSHGEVEIDLRTRSGARVLLESQPGKSFRLIVPATSLSPGFYELALSVRNAAGNKELLNYYYFQVK